MARDAVDSIDAAIITYAHNDHLLGLGDVVDCTRWTGSDCPIFIPYEVIPQVLERFAY